MKKILVLFALLWSAASLFGQQQQYEMRLQEGKRLYYQNRFDDARDRFEAVIRLAQYSEFPPEVMEDVEDWLKKCGRTSPPATFRCDTGQIDLVFFRRLCGNFGKSRFGLGSGKFTGMVRSKGEDIVVVARFLSGK